jgi:hypothetical protein
MTLPTGGPVRVTEKLLTDASSCRGQAVGQ